MGNLLDSLLKIAAVGMVIYSWHNYALNIRLSSSVVEQPPCKRQVVSSILTGGSSFNSYLSLSYQSRVLLWPAMILMLLLLALALVAQ